MSKKKPKFVKRTGDIQRNDVSLTKELAGALVQVILSGETLFPQTGKLLIPTETGEERFISTNTINSWIRRDNVVPETGIPLRDILNKARADYRAKKREETQDYLLTESERELKRVLNLRPTVVVRDMFGKVVKNEDGTPARRESVGILRVKVDTAKYLTERLDPMRYGRIDRTENKHLIFSLSDLRREKMKAQTNEKDTNEIT